MPKYEIDMSIIVTVPTLKDAKKVAQVVRQSGVSSGLTTCVSAVSDCSLDEEGIYIEEVTSVS